MGYVPEWDRVIRAARYLGVPPWELLQQPAIWIDLAIEHEYADNVLKNGTFRNSH